MVLGVADSWYLAQIAADAYVAGTLIDLLWPLAFILIAFAAWAQPRRTLPVAVTGIRAVSMPAVFMTIAVALLVHYAAVPEGSPCSGWPSTCRRPTSSTASSPTRWPPSSTV